MRCVRKGLRIKAISLFETVFSSLHIKGSASIYAKASEHAIAPRAGIQMNLVIVRNTPGGTLSVSAVSKDFRFSANTIRLRMAKENAFRTCMDQLRILESAITSCSALTFESGNSFPAVSTGIPA